MLVTKKYSNRRLYDTGESRYITLEELAERIRAGADVKVVDAKTGDDLTQATLTQIIIESRGAAQLLPVPLLTQLVRMGDDAFAEFLSRYMSSALELYFQAKQGVQAAVKPYNPFLSMGMPRPYPMFWGTEPTNVSQSNKSDVAELRKEVDELKQALKKRRKSS
jgi:polyhydroxyalkanoate synthesis repressor PhaR